MTDTRERFLREITERVPADRIAELHLFRPLRRGATETGIAVIAAQPDDRRPATKQDDGVSAAQPDDRLPAATQDDSVPAAEPDDRLPAAQPDDLLPAPDGTSIASRSAADQAEDSPYAPDDGEREDAPAAAAHPDRHTVFTARYRLTLKGVDRGKWEFDVVADADAPLTTVDSVVRGVQRRSGDDEEPERLTADGVRAALDGLSWRTTT
jgi:hypothetical protein